MGILKYLLPLVLIVMLSKPISKFLVNKKYETIMLTPVKYYSCSKIGKTGKTKFDYKYTRII